MKLGNHNVVKLDM